MSEKRNYVDQKTTFHYDHEIAGLILPTKALAFKMYLENQAQCQDHMHRYHEVTLESLGQIKKAIKFYTNLFKNIYRKKWTAITVVT